MGDLRKERKTLKEKNLILKILLNYSILPMCIAGALINYLIIIFLLLPGFQILISIFNCIFSNKWQTVLMLEVNLWISTILGLFLGKYLFLTYIVNDPISNAIFILEIKIGAVLVLIMGAITTLIKYISIKAKTNK